MGRSTNIGHDIPLVDLARQYEGIADEIQSALAEVIQSFSFIQGRRVADFEKTFTAATGIPHGTGCANGTVAIALALEAAGVARDDEVITVAHTFAATAEAIVQIGARPVFVDVEPGSYTMDPSMLERAITPRTKAVIPVHLYGTPADMESISGIAAGHGLHIIEDCAQAPLARSQGMPVGSFGTAATFSFYPGKNLGAYGDAGFLASKDPDLVQTCRSLLNHGRSSKYEHAVSGYNYRMDEMQAAVLSVKLPYLARWNERRREVAALYDAAFAEKGLAGIRPRPGDLPVYHLYVIEVSNRDEAVVALDDQGVKTVIHYPVPLHRQLAFKEFMSGDLPETERAASRVLSLPMFPEISESEIDRVIDAVTQVARA